MCADSAASERPPWPEAPRRTALKRDVGLHQRAAEAQPGCFAVLIAERGARRLGGCGMRYRSDGRRVTLARGARRREGRRSPWTEAAIRGRRCVTGLVPQRSLESGTVSATIREPSGQSSDAASLRPHADIDVADEPTNTCRRRSVQRSVPLGAHRIDGLRSTFELFIYQRCSLGTFVISVIFSTRLINSATTLIRADKNEWRGIKATHKIE